MGWWRRLVRVERTTVVFWGAELVSVMKGSGLGIVSLNGVSMLFLYLRMRNDWTCSRSALTGLGEAGSCERLPVQAGRRMLLRCLGQLLTETTPIPARSGGPTDASPGLHRRHCGAIKNLEGELMALRPGAMPLLGTWMALWQPFCEKWGVMGW